MTLGTVRILMKFKLMGSVSSVLYKSHNAFCQYTNKVLLNYEKCNHIGPWRDNLLHSLKNRISIVLGEILLDERRREMYKNVTSDMRNNVTI